MTKKDISRKDLLTSGVAALGASIAAGAAGAVQAATGSAGAGMTKGGQLTLRTSAAQLRAQAASASDPVKSAILRAASEQVLKNGGDKANFDLDFGLHFTGAANPAGQ